MGSIRTIPFVYDFAINGGAIGTINMNAYVPTFSIYLGCVIRPSTNLSSGGTAVIELGILGSSGDSVLDSTQGTLGDYRDFNSGTYGFVDGTIPAVQNRGKAITNFFGGQVTMSISGATLTGGSFQCIIMYCSALV